MWAELEAVREFGTTPMWRLSIYGLDASEPQVSVSIPVPDHAALLRWQVSRDGVFDTSLPLDLWQTGALSGTVNPTGRGRLDILLQAKLDPKQVALGTVIELEATVGSWTDNWPVEYQVDPFTRDEKLWPKNDHRAVEEFLHVDKQGGELLADLVARGWTLADLLRSVIDVQDRILAAGIMAVQGPQGDQGDPGDPGADGVVDYDEAWDRANHTGTQSADTLTDGTTNKAFLATERTNLSSAVTKLGSVDNTGALFGIVNATGTGSIPLIVKGMASQTGDLQQWQNSAGTSVARIAQDGGAVFVGSLYTIAAQATSGTGAYLAINGTNISVINRTTVSAVPLIVKGMAAQTGNLQEWQDSAGTALSKVYYDGTIWAGGSGFVSTLVQHTSFAGPHLALGSNSVTVLNRTSASNVPLIVKGMASQTGNLTEWQDSAGVVKAKMDTYGTLKLSNVADIGDTGPFLSLTSGAVVLYNRTTASNVPLVVKGMAAQSGDLSQWRNSSDTVLARVTSSGYISSIAGMATPTVAENTSTGPYLSLAANWMGVINRSTTSNVVFIVKGMASQTGNLQEWQNSAGTVLTRIMAGGSIDTGQVIYAPAIYDTSSTGPTLALGSASVTITNRTTVTNVPLIVKGMASQSGALQQWQDSAGVILAQVSSSGSFYGPYFQAAAGTGPYLDLASAAAVLVTNRTTTSNVPFIVKGMASQSGSLQQWQDSAGTALAWVSSTGAIATNGGLVAATLGSASAGYPYLSLGNNSITVLNRTTASNVPLIVKGMASQSGNMTEWQDSSSTALASVTSAGSINAAGNVRVGTFGIGSGGAKVIELANASVVPTTNPTGGVVVYSESGVLKARDPNGVITQLFPRLMELMVSVTDETTALTTGTAKLTFRIPRACAVTSVRANLNTASSSGNPAFDVNKNGTSIFSTTLTIDASEKTSVTAATAAVLTSNPITFADDDEVTIDIDTAGTGAKGAKLTFLGYYT